MPGSKAGRNGQIRLIRVLAHDLRNPVSGILAASQCLLEDAIPLLDSQQLTLLRSIESSSDLMLRLIDDMLEVAQAIDGGARLRLRPANVSRLIDHSIALHRPGAAAKSIGLKIRSGDAGTTVDLDAVKIMQAFNALLKNVVRCSPPGGEIEIDVAARSKNVVVGVRHVGGSESSRIADLAGISRGARKTSTLTLSAVRVIVEAHGGAIRMNKGAQHPAFTLTLPKSHPARKPERAGERALAKAKSSSIS
jgi:signal transduction histidine kinase